MNHRLSLVSGRLGLLAGLILAIFSTGRGVFAEQPFAEKIDNADASLIPEEEVSSLAREVTVRILGPVQGSGVLIDNQRSTYTVLTAWHVISEVGRGDELVVVTSDGREHLADVENIAQIGKVDLAILTFSSGSAYKIIKPQVSVFNDQAIWNGCRFVEI